MRAGQLEKTEEIIMRSHEALQAAISGKTVEHARKLGLSTGLINKWQEPHTDYTDSGAYNPLDRIETIIETSLALGNPPERAFAPINYLAERFGLITVPVPASAQNCKTVIHEFLKCSKEFGDIARETEGAMKDNVLGKAEAARIEKEAWELIRQTALLISAIKAATGRR